jgi:hypothetical protein
MIPGPSLFVVRSLANSPANSRDECAHARSEEHQAGRLRRTGQRGTGRGGCIHADGFVVGLKTTANAVILRKHDACEVARVIKKIDIRILLAVILAEKVSIRVSAICIPRTGAHSTDEVAGIERLHEGGSVIKLKLTAGIESGKPQTKEVDGGRGRQRNGIAGQDLEI